jgi:hypothetical protein
MEYTIGEIRNEFMGLPMNARMYIMNNNNIYNIMTIAMTYTTVDITGVIQINNNRDTKYVRDMDEIMRDENNNKRIRMRLYVNGAIVLFRLVEIETNNMNDEGKIILRVENIN